MSQGGVGGELPEGWGTGELGEYCEMYQPQTISKKEMVGGGEYPVFGANGQIGWYSRFNHEDSEVTVSCRGNCGSVNVIPEKSWITGNAMVVRPKSHNLSKAFLSYLLQSVDYRPVITGTAQQQITRSNLTRVPISVPPLAEQDRIIEILDEQLSRLDAAVKSVQTVREKASQFRRSLLHASFTGRLTQPANACDGIRRLGGTIPEGWDVASLAEIESRGLVKIGRGKIISKRDIASTPGDYPIYSSASLNGGEFGRYGKYLFDEELITWSIDGGGRLFHRDKHKFSVTNVGGWIRILKQETFGYKFLFLALSYLHSNVIFDWSRKAHPSVIRLVYDAIPIPPMEEQRQIVSILDENLSRLDQVLGVADEIERRANALRRSLLHAAFTGELTRSWREAHV